MEQEEQQQRKRDLSAKRERQRLKREEIKMNPPAPRRSIRVANKIKPINKTLITICNLITNSFISIQMGLPI